MGAFGTDCSPECSPPNAYTSLRTQILQVQPFALHRAAQLSSFSISASFGLPMYPIMRPGCLSAKIPLVNGTEGQEARPQM